LPAVTVHDYVSEMAVGTWLSFMKEGQSVNARLTWVSPLRTKYLFTSRSRARAFVYTPEELAYEISAGEVSLVVEPVPLFDRAVSAALNELGARQPPQAAPAPRRLALPRVLRGRRGALGALAFCLLRSRRACADRRRAAARPGAVLAQAKAASGGARGTRCARSTARSAS
jgi:hypothetical protein